MSHKSIYPATSDDGIDPAFKQGIAALHRAQRLKKKLFGSHAGVAQLGMQQKAQRGDSEAMMSPDKSEADRTAALLAALGLSLPDRATAFVPRVEGANWGRVAADPRQPIVFVDRPSEATRLCALGQPAIAVTGISKGKLAKWLRKRGAMLRNRADTH